MDLKEKFLIEKNYTDRFGIDVYNMTAIEKIEYIKWLENQIHYLIVRYMNTVNTQISDRHVWLEA